MTLRPLRRAPAAVALALSLTGCAFFAPLPDGPDRDEVAAADEARLVEVAREARALPQLTCVEVQVDEELGQTLTADPSVLARTSARGADRDALTRDLGRRFWESRVARMLSLSVVVTGPDGTSDLGQVLLSTAGPVGRGQLEAAYGPRPRATATPSPPPSVPPGEDCG